MLEKFLKLIAKLLEMFPVWLFWWKYVQKYINLESSSFLNLQMTTQFQAYTIFSVPKIIPINTTDTRKPLFSQQDFQNAIFLIFFGQILWKRNKFQLTNYLF